MKPVCHIIFMFLLINTGSSELYTALVDLEELLQTEAVLINILENYIKAEEQKLDLIKRLAHIYKAHHNKAAEDVQTYVANPINAYTLVKRLTTDWQQVEALMNTDMSHDFLQNITTVKETMKFPTDEDLNGAAVALTRLQDTYRLDTSSLARGELNGVKYSAELTAADCFELGRQAYNNEDYYHTLLWMKEAQARLNKEANQTIERSDILEYLAFSTYKQGNIPLALDLTNKLLEIVPAHPRAKGNKVYYEEELQRSTGFKKKGDDESETIPSDDAPRENMCHHVAVSIGETEKEISNFETREEVSMSVFSMERFHQTTMYGGYLDQQGKDLYERLCRGEIELPDEVTAQLKCRYINRKNPFLFIAPFKVEEAYKDPDIFVFHDIMADDEISTIKSMAAPRFKRATVQNSQTGELEVATYRISKSAWLKEYEHKHIANVVQRVEDMTGLTMTTAEELQVVNYGIGGHYEPHFDFARKDEKNAFKNLGTGNRIATVLFYMSDVAQGGATVFPVIKAALWPKKGTAAFWYNLHPSGDGDAHTRHAACPVLAGSKWVSNKWIHERGQEFRKPCTLPRPPPDRTA